MKFALYNSGRTIDLPDELVAQLGWRRGDLLSIEAEKGALRIVRAQTYHDRAMHFARRAMVKYRETFEALAKT